MAQRKIIFLTDTCQSLQQLANFALDTIFLPHDLGVAVFHKELFDIDLLKLFKANQLLHTEYSFVEIFEKIIAQSVLSKEEKIKLLALLQQKKVQPCIYFNTDNFLKDINQESLFADMALCTTSAAQKLMQYHADGWPPIGSYLNCPLLVIPNTTQHIENIFLVFDGQPSSMKAIKDFSYVLSHLYYNKNVTILSTMYGNGREQYEDSLLMQYAKLHIPNVAFMKLASNDINAILDFTNKSTNAMVVLGKNPATSVGIRIQNFKKHPITQSLFFTKN